MTWWISLLHESISDSLDTFMGYSPLDTLCWGTLSYPYMGMTCIDVICVLSQLYLSTENIVSETIMLIHIEDFVRETKMWIQYNMLNINYDGTESIVFSTKHSVGSFLEKCQLWWCNCRGYLCRCINNSEYFKMDAKLYTRIMTRTYLRGHIILLLLDIH